LGSNGAANVYFTMAITNSSAAIAYSRSTSTINLNIPDADASFRGTVSTGTQTLAGAKTFTSLLSGSAGIKGTATSTQAAIEQKGVLDTDYRSVTSTTTLSETDYVVNVGTLTADIVLNLPACNSTRDGWTFRFLKQGADAFSVTLDPSAAETFFDGSTTKVYFSQGNGATCQCQSGTTSWNILRL